MLDKNPFPCSNSLHIILLDFVTCGARVVCFHYMKLLSLLCYVLLRIKEYFFQEQIFKYIFFSFSNSEYNAKSLRHMF